MLTGSGDDRGGLALSESARSWPGSSSTTSAVRCFSNGTRRSPLPPSASLATDHSGRASAPVGAVPAGLKCMCPRRQRFTRSGPADLGSADRDGRGCVAANGECAGRSLRAGRRAALVVSLRAGALSLAPTGRSRRRERERADGSIVRDIEETPCWNTGRRTLW